MGRGQQKTVIRRRPKALTEEWQEIGRFELTGLTAAASQVVSSLRVGDLLKIRSWHPQLTRLYSGLEFVGELPVSAGEPIHAGIRAGKEYRAFLVEISRERSWNDRREGYWVRIEECARPFGRKPSQVR